ncbi:unnamed protein product [Moneuplotes crassus]|uniref:Uncharacterized protein n=1 Tax=Euplotes crassus TaxID=5936 RepID=A0AAD1XAS6_EUPCR|nr:unnamed protein product [Moneuplotes crassus]
MNIPDRICKYFQSNSRLKTSKSYPSSSLKYSATVQPIHPGFDTRIFIHLFIYKSCFCFISFKINYIRLNHFMARSLLSLVLSPIPENTEKQPWLFSAFLINFMINTVLPTHAPPKITFYILSSMESTNQQNCFLAKGFLPQYSDLRRKDPSYELVSSNQYQLDLSYR